MEVTWAQTRWAYLLLKHAVLGHASLSTPRIIFKWHAFFAKALALLLNLIWTYDIPHKCFPLIDEFYALLHLSLSKSAQNPTALLWIHPLCIGFRNGMNRLTRYSAINLLSLFAWHVLRSSEWNVGEAISSRQQLNFRPDSFRLNTLLFD